MIKDGIGQLHDGVDQLQDALLSHFESSDAAPSPVKKGRSNRSKSSRAGYVTGWNKFYEAFCKSGTCDLIREMDLDATEKRDMMIKEAGRAWAELQADGTGEETKAHWKNLAMAENSKLHLC
jgi:hypothetical protein